MLNQATIKKCLMPEGPSRVILKELTKAFEGKRIKDSGDNSKALDIGVLPRGVVLEFITWGIYFLIRFKEFTIRIPFLLFGSHRMNERKDTSPRLSLIFNNGEINFYACSVKLLVDDLDHIYDWSADALSPQWDPVGAINKLKTYDHSMVCDVLLNQQIFSTVRHNRSCIIELLEIMFEGYSCFYGLRSWIRSKMKK